MNVDALEMVKILILTNGSSCTCIAWRQKNVSCFIFGTSLNLAYKNSSPTNPPRSTPWIRAILSFSMANSSPIFLVLLLLNSMATTDTTPEEKMTHLLPRDILQSKRDRSHHGGPSGSNFPFTTCGAINVIDDYALGRPWPMLKTSVGARHTSLALMVKKLKLLC